MTCKGDKMADTKKYYWLKLKRDFFKRHDVAVIESMQNGDKYLLFYMKLLVESIDHEGALRFSDTVPYNDTMLAAITRTDIDIVRSAVKVFQEFGMMDMLDDGTLFMKQVETMIGDETEWASKKRLYREKQRQIDTKEGQKRTLSDKSKRLEIELDKEIEKEIEYTPDKPAKPQKHKHGEYAHVLLTSDEYLRLCEEWGEPELLRMIKELDEGIEMKGYKYKNHNLALRRWKSNEKNQRNGYSKPLPVQTRTTFLDMED